MATEGSPPNPDFYLEGKPAAEADSATHEAYEMVLVEMASLAEKAERYEDMCKYLTEVVTSKHARSSSLRENERNLLSVAFKNVVGGLRSSWRTFKSDNTNSELFNKYSAIVENELEQKCLEVLRLLESKLIPNCASEEPDGKVFFLKMCGDYYRYLAEFRDTEDYKKAAEEHYKKAYDEAKLSLPETHPTRLGLALNFSVCHYEILKNHQKACELAKRAFDEAIQKLDTLNDANYKDSTLIMQLLRDNLTLWTSENNEENDD